MAYAQALCIIGLAEDLEEDQGYSMELARYGGFFPHAASDLATIHNSHAHHKHGRGLWKIAWVPPEDVWQNTEARVLCRNAVVRVPKQNADLRVVIQNAEVRVPNDNAELRVQLYNFWWYPSNFP